jgi:hypothetical protein
MSQSNRMVVHLFSLYISVNTDICSYNLLKLPSVYYVPATAQNIKKTLILVLKGNLFNTYGCYHVTAT